MSVDNPGARVSKKSVWAGRILSGLVVLFLIPDGIVKFIRPAPVLEVFALAWTVLAGRPVARTGSSAKLGR
jgi:hypothetical protein